MTGPEVEQPEDAKRLKGGTQGTSTLLVGMGSYFLRGWVGIDILVWGAQVYIAAGYGQAACNQKSNHPLHITRVM